MKSSGISLVKTRHNNWKKIEITTISTRWELTSSPGRHILQYGQHTFLTVIHNLYRIRQHNISIIGNHILKIISHRFALLIISLQRVRVNELIPSVFLHDLSKSHSKTSWSNRYNSSSGVSWVIIQSCWWRHSPSDNRNVIKRGEGKDRDGGWNFRELEWGIFKKKLITNVSSRTNYHIHIVIWEQFNCISSSKVLITLVI